MVAFHVGYIFKGTQNIIFIYLNKKNFIIGYQTHRLINSPKANVDPTTSNEFAHSVWRYLHFFNPENFNYYDSSKIIIFPTLLSIIKLFLFYSHRWQYC